MKSEGMYIDTGDGHQLYVETIGGRDNYPVLFLHGGPGYGFFPQDRRFFDPHRHFAILYDQRGCGRSLPYASIDNNTTQYLVDDINTLLDRLSIDKVCLFGGSWGSTLALLYAMDHPERISRLVLRGIFSASHDTIDLFEEKEVSDRIKRARSRAMSHVPQGNKSNPIEYYLSKMTHGTPDEKATFAYELEIYGAVLNFPTLPLEKIEADLKQRDYFPHALILAHYAHHKFFLEDGFIWNNINKLENIPTDIIHGNQDMLCPVSNAHRLHKAIKRSTLHIVEGGHSSLDPAIDRKLRDTMASIH